MRLLIVANSLPHSFHPAGLPLSRQGSQRRRRQLSVTSASPVSSLAAASSGSDNPSWSEMRLGDPQSSLSSVEDTTEWQFSERPNHPALIALQGLPPDTEHLFIGWPGYCHVGGDDPVTPSPEQIDSLTKGYRGQLNSLPIWIDQTTAQGHYEGVCKAMLWPMLHSLLFDKITYIGTFESSGWLDHVHFNECLAEAIAQEYQPGDQILILDYHLMLLPAMIRRLREDALIAFYLRSPFPSSELFRCLPAARELLQGMLGANLITFQSFSYARHFISCCTRILGVDAHPRGVDYKGFPVEVSVAPIGHSSLAEL